MGKCCKIFWFVVVATMAWATYNVYDALFYVPPVPNLPLDRYWGSGRAPKVKDTTVRSFRIEFEPKMIEDLKHRLDADDFFTEPLEGVGFEYGFNNKYLKEIVQFWRNGYDFAERERYLNQYPHFKTNIQGLDIHFMHVKPKNLKPDVKVLPLLLLHGWPGSIREFYEAVPHLITPRVGYDFVFELVIPSLPGYGFSQAAAKTGMGPAQMAVIMRNLMDRLGYQKYIVQGGDWGALIGSHMAAMWPDKVIGYHTNAAGSMSPLSFVKLFLGSMWPSMVVSKRHEHKIYPLGNSFNFVLVEGGYAHLQATKPDTIGVALRTSPIGLAAYIIEKFSAWTNTNWMQLTDGGITKSFRVVNLLDNIMIYWSSRSITTSVRLYKESFSRSEFELKLDLIPIQAPTAIAMFEYEILYSTDWQLKDKYANIVQKSEFPSGGHFAAFELPKEFSEDVWKAAFEFQNYYERKESKSEL